MEKTNEENVNVEVEDSEVVDEEQEDVVDTDEQSQETNEYDEKINALEAEKTETYDKLLRLQAEYDNYKKRTIKERESQRRYQSQDIVTEIIPVLDNFERALQVEETDANKQIIEGITMVYNQLKTVFENQDVEVIETVGSTFDPNLHHAVMQVEDDAYDSDVVVEELQKGYLLKDRVIRPAMVKVNQ